MGNYRNLELDFLNRTIHLIDQYTKLVQKENFSEQLNYTLTINCLLGAIVMPKERVIDYIPKEELNKENLHKMGLTHTQIDDSIQTLPELIKNLRHSIAHFSIEIESECNKNLIDWIVFTGTRNQPKIIARFKAPELYPFLRYYANSLSENLIHFLKQSDNGF